MTSHPSRHIETTGYAHVRARAKVLAREDREMRASLIRLRQEAGLTQKDVAARMGVTQQAIHKFERYDSDPKLSTLRRYANAVGAVVSHGVVPDVGQSVWLASAPTWEGIITSLPEAASPSSPSPHTSSPSSWSSATLKDFTIAG